MFDNFLFSPIKRIREKRDFQRVFRQGKRLYSPFYILYYQTNHLPYSRLGVITSKRNIRTAVRRNVAKRVAREAFRTRQDWVKGKDIVIVAQKRANLATKSELHQCLEKLLKKLQGER